MALSAAMLLRWLDTHGADAGLHRAALSIDSELEATIYQGIRTADLGGTSSTNEFSKKVEARIATGVR
ncbi:hypothetical protein CH298_21805 [Rhodococcoides fascians]|uniref:hypothetical protein n=1 Tax=Rhodococcoides fascians TaxID=1828 RepID=UPI000B9B1061|nr:hypothetical protein [Rhodococcus fascians]OZE85331.1 hypothetical protein CH303_22160 [Rhodococcus fascians]OZF11838.1 hypothetical protein CH298_21805 [Rhodococcus fascians]OZF14607.1 hypothetical protein CH297_22185 [Rhodococcus fascians]OZF71382.1 hypothetical protein CH308_06160 [Rhodococcus fascians]OZF72854.1 hypothetical protein CH307_06165 [Rhodococcus fascians]